MKTKNTLLAAGLISAFSLAANAATVTYDDNKVFNYTPNLGSNVLTLSQFDPGLGTLTGVSITIEYVVPVQTLALDNDFTGSASGTYSFGEFGSGAFNVSVPTPDAGFVSIGLGDFSYTTQSTSYNLLGDNGIEGTSTFDEQPGDVDYFEFNTTAVTLGVTGHDVFSGVWGSYTGLGTFTIDLGKTYSANLSDQSSSGAGNLEQNLSLVSGTFAASVTYDYDTGITPIPETSTYGFLFVASSLGLLIARRRRR